MITKRTYAAIVLAASFTLSATIVPAVSPSNVTNEVQRLVSLNNPVEEFTYIKGFYEAGDLESFQRGIDALASIKADHPSLDDLRFMEAFSFVEQKKYDEARAAYQQFEKDFPDSPYVEKLPEHLAKLEERKAELPAVDQFEAIRAHYERGDQKAFTDAIRELEGRKPGHASLDDLRFMEAFSLVEQRKFDEARAAYQQFEKDFPESPYLKKMPEHLAKLEERKAELPAVEQFDVIRAHYERGDQKAFTDAIRELEGRKPGHASLDDLRILEAYSLIEKGHYAEAREAYAKFAADFPKSPYMEKVAGHLKLLSEKEAARGPYQEKYDAALELYHSMRLTYAVPAFRELQEASDLAIAQGADFYLVKCYFDMKAYKVAAKYATQALAKPGESAYLDDLLLIRAYATYKGGEYDEAKAAYDDVFLKAKKDEVFNTALDHVEKFGLDMPPTFEMSKSDLATHKSDLKLWVRSKWDANRTADSRPALQYVLRIQPELIQDNEFISEAVDRFNLEKRYEMAKEFLEGLPTDHAKMLLEEQLAFMDAIRLKGGYTPVRLERESAFTETMRTGSVLHRDMEERNTRKLVMMRHFDQVTESMPIDPVTQVVYDLLRGEFEENSVNIDELLPDYDRNNPWDHPLVNWCDENWKHGLWPECHEDVYPALIAMSDPETTSHYILQVNQLVFEAFRESKVTRLKDVAYATGMDPAIHDLLAPVAIHWYVGNENHDGVEQSTVDHLKQRIEGVRPTNRLSTELRVFRNMPEKGMDQ